MGRSEWASKGLTTSYRATCERPGIDRKALKKMLRGHEISESGSIAQSVHLVGDPSTEEEKTFEVEYEDSTTVQFQLPAIGPATTAPTKSRKAQSEIKQEGSAESSDRISEMVQFVDDFVTNENTQFESKRALVECIARLENGGSGSDRVTVKAASFMNGYDEYDAIVLNVSHHSGRTENLKITYQGECFWAAEFLDFEKERYKVQQ